MNTENGGQQRVMEYNAKIIYPVGISQGQYFIWMRTKEVTFRARQKNNIS